MDKRSDTRWNKGKSLIEDRAYCKSLFTPERMHRESMLAEFEVENYGASDVQRKAYISTLPAVYAQLCKEDKDLWEFLSLDPTTANTRQLLLRFGTRY